MARICICKSKQINQTRIQKMMAIQIPNKTKKIKIKSKQKFNMN